MDFPSSAEDALHFSVAVMPPALRYIADHVVAASTTSSPFGVHVACSMPVRVPPAIPTPLASELEGMLNRVGRRPPWPFLQEAIITVMLSRGMLSHEVLRVVRERGLGIRPESPLSRLREYASLLLQQGYECGDEARVLALWGSTTNAGDQLFRELGQLARAGSMFLPPTIDRFTALAEWVEASGVSHHSCLKAASGIIEESFAREMATLPVHGAEQLDGPGFIKLNSASLDWATSHDMLDFARSSGFSEFGAKRFCYQLFRCLSRLAAFTRWPYTYWCRGWLRGNATERPIPGAGTYEKHLLHVLKAAYLEEVAVKAKRGKHCTVYRLRMKIEPGLWGRDVAAQQLGLVLNREGRPLKG